MVERFGLRREHAEPEDALEEARAVDDVGRDDTRRRQEPREGLEDVEGRGEYCHKIKHDGGIIQPREDGME